MLSMDSAKRLLKEKSQQVELIPKLANLTNLQRRRTYTNVFDTFDRLPEDHLLASLATHHLKGQNFRKSPLKVRPNPKTINGDLISLCQTF